MSLFIRKWIVTLVVLVCLSFPDHAMAQTVLRVDVNEGSVTGDGSGWGSLAFKHLQDALDEVVESSPHEVWVADGVYYADLRGSNDSNDPDDTFKLKNNTKIRAGFVGSVSGSGGETLASQRKPLINIAILSGDIQQNTTQTDNTYHIVTAADVDFTAILDGFSIKFGYAVDAPALDGGSDANLTGAGAGMVMIGGEISGPDAEPVILRCKFQNNIALRGGGAFLRGGQQHSPQFQDCEFTDNQATTGHGGGYAVYGIGSFRGTSEFVNCLFQSNVAGGTGGGMYAVTIANLRVINCTLAQNRAGGPTGTANGGGIAHSSTASCENGCSYSVSNSILWDNGGSGTAQQINGFGGVTYSCVQGGITGTGNISTDPEFINSPTNLRLAADSPCVDVAPVANVPGDAFDLDQDSIFTAEKVPDLDGMHRVSDGVAGNCSGNAVDMGAYERPMDGCIADVSGAFGGPSDGLVNVYDLLYVIGQWGNTCPCTGDIAAGPCGDNAVNVQDLLAVIGAWGHNCSTGELEDLGYTIEDANDCMNACSLVYTGYTTDWYGCVDKCIDGIQNQ